MKNIFISLLLVLAIMGANHCFATEQSMANNELSSGQAVPYKDEGVTVPEMLNTWWAIGKHYNETYPGASIESDFTEDVAKVFPYLNQQEVYDREENIRLMIKGYRYFYNFYEEVKAKMLIPDAPPLIVEESEYDLPQPDKKYIESDDMVVVEDFKKVLSYGGNKRDFEALAAKQRRDNSKKAIKSDFDVLSMLLRKLEWRKLPYYGVIYDDPFTGSLGSGEWVSDDKVSLRVISSHSTINNNSEIKAGLHFNLPNDEFLLAQNFRDYKKPKFSFEGSENLAQAQYSYPLPSRLLGENSVDAAVYQNNFAFPLAVTVKDINQPLKLKVQADFTTCDIKQNCRPRHIEAKFDLEAGQGFYSSVSNFVTQSFYSVPTAQNSYFTLTKAVVDDRKNDEAPQMLRLEFNISKDPNNFDVYVDGKDDIQFLRPRIAISDNKIIVRLEPENPKVDLEDKEFTISARLNALEYLSETKTVRKASIFDYLPASLSLGIIALAIVGGFLLNFMPCVFPVLSIKLLSLTQFGANRPENLRRSFLLTLVGIFITFEAIAIVLVLLKLAGYAIGWGMQFQNPYFLILMIFAVILFMSVIWGLIGFKTPDWLVRRLHNTTDKDSLMHFLTGVLVVVMATPCTAPYLGTAIGFALGGNLIDIFAVMTAVALGLSLPYIFVLLYPGIVIFLPKPGPWMNRLNFWMGLMLFLTLIWLLVVLAAQAGFWTVFRLAIYLFFFVFVLVYRRFLLDSIETSEYEPETKVTINKLYRICILSVLLFIFAVATVDVVWHFNAVQTERNATKVKVMDYEAIANKVKEGKIVVVAVGADWCLTCKYNEVAVFNNAIVENLIKSTQTELIEVDWTEYNSEVLDFMKKFGRQGLPFYVVFSPMIPDGMVLPEVLSEREFSRIIKSIDN